MDWDRFSKNDFMGSTEIPLKALHDQGGQIDDWFALENPKSKKQQVGHVHLRISVDDGQDSEKFGKHTKQRRKSLLQREEQKLDALTAFIGTWNVGNAPPPDDLSSWIPKGGADIYVLGAQECQYKPRSPHQTCADDWVACLRNHFGEDYILVRDCLSLLEIRLCVFAHRDVMGLIKNIDAGKEATGVAHVYGNKGGTSIAFDVLGTRLCFVNSHLAAHQGQTKARNANYIEIVDGTSIGIPKQDFLNQYHHLFWIGDLNYRLNVPGQIEEEKEPSPEIFEKITDDIKAEKWEELFSHDQLTEQIAKDLAFVGFEEGVYNFPPTFKVLKQKDLEYTPKRTPSWCDRILWRSAPGPAVTQASLEACPDVETSDHKPVRATFSIPVLPVLRPPIDKKHRQKVSIRSMKGHDLIQADPNGKSDPYVIFLKQAPLQKQYQTPVIEKTLNPEWEDHQLQTMNLMVGDLESCRYSFILIRVMDADKVTADDAIGQGMLCLGEASDHSNQFVDFAVKLTHHGLPAGSLTGQVKLIPPE